MRRSSPRARGLGDAPRGVLAGAAEGARVLKRDGVRDADRHAELERLLGARVPDERSRRSSRGASA